MPSEKTSDGIISNIYNREPLYKRQSLRDWEYLLSMFHPETQQIPFHTLFWQDTLFRYSFLLNKDFQLLNTTPKKYINSIRVTHAKELLSGTNYPVISIAEMCGFSDNYYFCKFFKTYTGLSPLKYRAEFFHN